MENQRKTVAVICEYNPFHFGHKYQIEQLKEKYGCVVGIMSGAFVQRGEVAVEDKYRRAEAAVKGGMNLVVELPFPYCAASAADFAAAGVDIAAAIGADALSFGCEDEGLTELAVLVADRGFEEKTAAHIKKNPSLSYPRARMELAGEVLGEEAANKLTRPNNILGVEYVAHAIKKGYGLELAPVKRQPCFKSSSEIRRCNSFEGQIPFPELFGEVRRLEYRERELIAILRRGVPEGLYCIDRSFAATLRQSALNATSLAELVEGATGKTYTAARVRRGILAVWLGIRGEAVKVPPSYTNLLAADRVGLDFLRAGKKSRSIPIVTKPADYKELTAEAAARAEAALSAEEEAMLCTRAIAPYSSPLKATPFIKRLL